MREKKEPTPTRQQNQRENNNPFAPSNFFADTGFFPAQSTTPNIQKQEDSSVQEPSQNGGIKRTKNIPYDLKTSLSQGHEEQVAKKVDELMKMLWKGKGLSSTESVVRGKEKTEYAGRVHFKNWLRKSFFGTRGEARDSEWRNEVNGTGTILDDHVIVALEISEIEFVGEDDIKRQEGQSNSNSKTTEKDKSYHLGTEYYNVDRGSKETKVNENSSFESSGYNIYTANIKLKIKVTNSHTKTSKMETITLSGVTLSTARDLDAQVKLEK